MANPHEILDESIFGNRGLEEDVDNSNALVLLSKSSKKKRGRTEDEPKPLSKRAQRKIEQLKRKEAMQAMAAEAVNGMKELGLNSDVNAKLQLTQALRARRCKRKLQASKQEMLIKHTDEKPVEQELAGENEPEISKVSKPTEPTRTLEEAIANLRAQKQAQKTARKKPPQGDLIKREWLHHLCKEPLKRNVKIEQVRLALPAYQFEQEIVDACLENLVVIVTGGTGCGKSTQVPQFLYEAGFALSYKDKRLKIGITQPRRFATLAVAARVAEEMGSDGAQHVGYQVRFERSSAHERLKFMTDGILLKILEGDFLLRDFSLIVLDEIHERSTNCDLLLGILSRVVLLRRELFESGKTDIPPLRLVLMSATARLADFTENPALFPRPPAVIKIPAKTHPVTIHFNRTTPLDYVGETKKKINQIHKRLPPGSILVFLPGKQDIHEVQKLLTKGGGSGKRTWRDLCDSEDEVTESENEEAPSVVHSQRGITAVASTDDQDFTLPGGDAADDKELGYEEELTLQSLKQTEHYKWLGSDGVSGVLRVVPCYATLPAAKQKLAFSLPAPGERIVILATNIAETSVTLPNIRYVIDCGFEKQRVYSATGVASAFEVRQISKANADQRAGRAGRLGPGHCYRLYSSAVFEHEFKPFPPVQLLNEPLDGVLQMIAALGIRNLDRFPFPNAPTVEATTAACERLKLLGLITQQKTGEQCITPLGKLAALFPLPPSYSVVILKALAAARTTGRLVTFLYASLSTACLSIGTELFQPNQRERPKAKQFEAQDDLDVYILTLLSFCRLPSIDLQQAFCHKYGILTPKLEDILMLAIQILRIAVNKLLTREELKEVDEQLGVELHSVIEQLNKATSDKAQIARRAFQQLPLPSLDIRDGLRLYTATGLNDRIAVRVGAMVKLSNKETSDAVAKQLSKLKNAYWCSGLTQENVAYIHQSSKFYKQRPRPDVFVYNVLIRTESSFTEFFMKDLIEVEDPVVLDKACHGNTPSLLKQYIRRTEGK